MEIMEAIKERYSLRSFSQKEIEPEKLQKILEAGRLAPTAANQQRTRAIVVTDPKLRKGMAEACSNQKFVGEAPAILVLCADDERIMRCGQSARGIDCAIALSFMCLEAAALGIEGCWIGSFDPEQVRKLLSIPEGYVIPAVYPLGYPKEDDGVRREKKPMEEFFVSNRF